jgi:hypothetical protein
MQLRTLRWRGNCLACAMPTAVLQVLATQLGLLPISPPIPQDAETRRAHLARMRQQWVVRWRSTSACQASDQGHVRYLRQ